MNYTHLFSIEWDTSYNDPDYRIPGSFQRYLDEMGTLNQERLATMLEFLADGIRKRTCPFEKKTKI